MRNLIFFIYIYTFFYFSAAILYRFQNVLLTGGKEARFGQFPHQVHITVKWITEDILNTNECSGSIIARQVILTAAHCVYDGNGHRLGDSEIIVQVGSLTINPPGATYRVNYFIAHEKYNDKTLQNDIALLILHDRITYQMPVVEPINPMSTEIPDGSELTISGWGDITSNEKGSNNLLYNVMEKINDQECKILLAENYHPGMFCTFLNGISIGSGDSGGPVMYDNDGKKYIAGIISFGKVSDSDKYPSVHTKVSHYYNWILKNLRKLSMNFGQQENV